MKALAYVRVSTDDQSLTRQKEELQEYCNFKKIELVKFFGEKASGLQEQRQALTELLNEVETNKEINLVVIHELSRLGRTLEVLNTVKTLHKNNVALFSKKEGITTLNEDGTENTSGKLMITLLTGINNYEVDTIKYRIRSGNRSAIRNGKRVGTVNYGYYSDQGFIKIHPIESETIKEIFNLYNNNTSPYIIAKILNEKGIKTRQNKMFYEPTIQAILRNTVYIGKKITKMGKEELLNLPDLRIIDDDTFNKAQKVRKSNTHKIDKHKKHNYLLDGRKIVCGNCQEEFGVLTYYHPISDKMKSHYNCISYRKEHKCKGVGISINKIENFIQRIILFLFQDNLLEKLNNTSLKDDLNQNKLLLEEVTDSIEKVKKSKLNLIRKDLNEEIGHDEYLILLKELENKIESLQNKLNILQQEKLNIQDSLNNIMDIQALKKGYIDGVKIPRNIVNTIITKIVFTNTNEFPSIFNHATDNVIRMDVYSTTIKYSFLISQRKQFIYYMDGVNGGFTLDKFLDVNNDKGFNPYTKELFDFLNEK